MKYFTTDEYLPHRANAGLNFFVSSFASVGPGMQVLLIAGFEQPTNVVPFISIALLITTIISVTIPNILLEKSKISFSTGYFFRLIFTISTAAYFYLIITIPNFNEELNIWTLTLLFLFVFLLHKSFFNIGWLYVMRSITPKDKAGVYVARVRRLNLVISSFLAVGLSGVIFFSGYDNAAIFILITVILYTGWSWLNISIFMKNRGKNALEIIGNLKTDMNEFSVKCLLDELTNKNNLSWISKSILPSFMVPPLISFYLIFVLKFDAGVVMPVFMISGVSSALLLPLFMSRVAQHFEGRISKFCFICSLIMLLLLASFSMFDTQGVYVIVPIFSIVFVGSLCSQLLSIDAHNSVIFSSQEDKKRPGVFPLYNLVLDLSPIISIYIFSLSLSYTQNSNEWVYLFCYLAFVGLLGGAYVIDEFRKKVRLNV